MNILCCECCNYIAKDNWDLKRHLNTKRHFDVLEGKANLDHYCSYVKKDGSLCNIKCLQDFCKHHNETRKKYNKSDKVKKIYKDYRKENKEKIKENHKKWYEENKDYCLQKQKEYNNENKERINMKNKQYYYKMKNDEYTVFKEKIRGLKKIDANRFENIDFDNYITIEWIQKMITNSNSSCVYCHKKLLLSGYESYDKSQMSIDRLFNDTPHYQFNCIVCCLGCNLVKSGKNIDQFKPLKKNDMEYNNLMKQFSKTILYESI